MTINWYGEGCFKIQEGGITLLIDPVESSSGLSAPRFKADIIIKTIMPALLPGKVKPETAADGGQVIPGPGEYEIKGASISGWPLLKESSKEFLKSVYRVRFDDLALGFLGNLTGNHEPEIFEELGDIDILFIPGGGKPFIDQEAAAKLIRQIEPRLVIPSFFHVPGLKRKAETVTDFLKELGHKAEPEEKLTIKKRELGEKLRVVVLKV